VKTNATKTKNAATTAITHASFFDPNKFISSAFYHFMALWERGFCVFKVGRMRTVIGIIISYRSRSVLFSKMKILISITP
jgi:hypothetical protein